MADEKNIPENPEEMSDEDVKAVAESVPAPSEYPEGQAGEAREKQPPENGLEEAAVEGLEASEQVTDAPVVQAFDEGVSAIERGIESTMSPEDAERAYMETHAHHGDTTTLFGRTYDIPIYTSVFMALGVLTVAEVILAELLGGIEPLKIALLLGIAIAKAALVVVFYMHLNTDSRIFAITLGLPLFLVVVGVIYLIAVPSTGGY